MILLRRLIVLALLVYTLFWVMDWYHDRRAALGRPAHVHAFIQRYAGMAEEVSRQSGVPSALILAVGALESSWGSSELTQRSNNFFGIKSDDPALPKCCLPTREFVNRRAYTVKACFRAYDDPRGSFYDFTRLLASDDRYESLFDHHPDDYVRWAQSLQDSGYATDPRYAEKLIRVIRQYRLH
jgi:flagellar protein FlgJ